MGSEGVKIPCQPEVAQCWHDVFLGKHNFVMLSLQTTCDLFLQKRILKGLKILWKIMITECVSQLIYEDSTKKYGGLMFLTQ